MSRFKIDAARLLCFLVELAAPAPYLPMIDPTSLSTTTPHLQQPQHALGRPPRIGLYGGSFDPIHLGHLKTARYVLEHMALDYMYLLPNASPPHKSSLKLPYATRVEMIAAALRDFNDPRFQISYIEQDPSLKHYTVNTLQLFHQEHPETEVFFIMGMDSFLTLDTWRSYERLIELANIVILPRPHYDYAEHTLKPELATLTKNCLVDLRYVTPHNQAPMVETAPAAKATLATVLQGHRYYILPAPEVDVSSTEIRALLKQGYSKLDAAQRQLLSQALSPSTLEYIRAQQLYMAV